MRRWLPGSVGVGVAVLGEEELLRSDAGSQMPSLAPAVRGKTVDEVVRNVAQSAAGLAADRALPLGKHQILNQPWNSGQIQFGSPGKCQSHNHCPCASMGVQCRAVSSYLRWRIMPSHQAILLQRPIDCTVLMEIL